MESGLVLGHIYLSASKHRGSSVASSFFFVFSFILAAKETRSKTLGALSVSTCRYVGFVVSWWRLFLSFSRCLLPFHVHGFAVHGDEWVGIMNALLRKCRMPFFLVFVEDAKVFVMSHQVKYLKHDSMKNVLDFEEQYYYNTYSAWRRLAVVHGRR